MSQLSVRAHYAKYLGFPRSISYPIIPLENTSTPRYENSITYGKQKVMVKTSDIICIFCNQRKRKIYNKNQCNI
jgi:hypothetical protein